VLGSIDDTVEYTMTMAHGNADQELPSMQAWLTQTGTAVRSRRVAAPPEPGRLGVAGEALLVALAPGGVAIALIGAVISWLRGRRSDVALRVTTNEGRTVEVTARGLRDLDADGVARLVADTVAALEPPAITRPDPAVD